MPVLSICIVGLLVSRSVKWACLVGTLHKGGIHAHTGMLQLFCALYHVDKPTSLSPIIIIQEECMNTLCTYNIHMFQRQVNCCNTIIVYHE